MPTRKKTPAAKAQPPRAKPSSRNKKKTPSAKPVSLKKGQTLTLPTIPASVPIPKNITAALGQPPTHAETAAVMAAEKSAEKHFSQFCKRKLSTRRMRAICTILDVKFSFTDSFAALDQKLLEQRPDMHRNKALKVLYGYFEHLDYTNPRSFIPILLMPIFPGSYFGLFFLYQISSWTNVFSWLSGSKTLATGQALYALQRQEARALMDRPSSGVHSNSFSMYDGPT